MHPIFNLLKNKDICIDGGAHFMNKAYLLTGGNEGERLGNLLKAKNIIGDVCGNLTQLSWIYETAPWGDADQQPYLNQALCLETNLSAEKLMHTLLLIEEEMGRVRLKKFGPRTIDIDILFFNDLIIEAAGLQIPHPRFAFRRFALTPMNEIAPGLVHPILKKTVSELLLECTDPLDVKKM